MGYENEESEGRTSHDSRNQATQLFKENEAVSSRNLFTFFCNNVLLGQWELARACISKLSQEKTLVGVDVSEILKAITQNPYGFSHGSKSLQSPHVLSWLSLSAYRGVTESQQEEVDRLRQNVEFRLLLSAACPQAQEATIHELYTYYSGLCAMADGSSKAPEFLSLYTQELICSLLLTQPAMGHALISSYMQKMMGDSMATYKCKFEMLYIKCLTLLLKQLKTLSIVTCTSSSFGRKRNPSKSKHKPGIVDSSASSLYKVSTLFVQLLSLFCPSTLPNDSEALITLIEDLCKLLLDTQASNSYLSVSAVYSALLTYPHSCLLKMFSSTLVDLQLSLDSLQNPPDDSSAQPQLSSSRAASVEGTEQPVLTSSSFGSVDSATSLTKSVELCKRAYSVDSEQDDLRKKSLDTIQLGISQKCVVALSQWEDRGKAWQHMYHISQKSHLHFIPLIIKTSLELVSFREFSMLQKLLSPPEFVPLQPVVLLLGWEHCSTVEDATALLEIFNSISSDSSMGGVLSLACQKLQHQLKLINWCISNTSSLYQRNDYLLKEKVRKLLHSIDIRSVLHVLRQSTKLSCLAEADVFAMLEAMPEPDQEVDKASKSVHFSLDYDEDSGVLGTVKHGAYHVEKEANAMMYRGYCILRNFMSALSFSADSSHWQAITSEASAQAFFPHNIDGHSGGHTPSGFMRTMSQLHDVTFSRSMSAGLNTSFDQSVETDVWNKHMESFQQQYNEEVMSKMRGGQEHLSHTYPLTYRVELLEDIFSLLFATNEDVNEDQSDSGGDEAAFGGSKGNLSSGESSLQEQRNDTITESPEIQTSLDEPSFFVTSGANKSSFSEFGSVQEAAEWDLRVNQDVRNPDDLVGQTGESTAGIGSEITQANVTHPVFSISKQVLKDDRERRPDGRHAGHISAASACSTSSVFRLGFIANEFFVRDVLATLNIAVSDLRTAHFALLSKKPTAGCEISKSLEMELREQVVSGVTTATLQHRINQLTQYISEATWRFQLVTHDWLPGEVGNVSVNLGKLIEASNEETKMASRDCDRKHSRRKRTRTGTASGRESSRSADSESHISATDCSTGQSGTASGSLSYGPHFNHMSSKMISSVMYGASDVWQAPIVSRMLASSTSLLTMCLKKAEYKRARQVIQMFSLSKSTEMTEVEFAEQYESAVKTQSKMPSSGVGWSPQGKTKSSSLRPSLSLISSKAIAGVVSVTSTSAVDQVLSASRLPSFSKQILQSVTDSCSQLALHIDNALIPAMIVFDLAIVSCRTWDASLKLLEMSQSRLPTLASPRSPITEKVDLARSEAPFGFRHILNTLMTLVKLGSNPEACTETFERYYKRSNSQVLLTGTLPLNTSLLKTSVTMITELEKGIKRVCRAINEVQQQEAMHKSQTDVENKIAQKPMIRDAMKFLLEVISVNVPEHGLTVQVLRDLVDRGSAPRNYLYSLYDHVKKMACMLQEFHTEKKDPKLLEYFTVLDEQPTQTLGHLIFVDKLAPTRLEGMATKLHIDLNHIIVNGCCPKVPVLKYLSPPARCVKEVFHKLVLNCSDSCPGEVGHPLTLTMDILGNLIRIMKHAASQVHRLGGAESDAAFDMECAVWLIEQGLHLSMFTGIQELKYVNLDMMSDNDEYLSFYGNLINILGIHVLFVQLENILNQTYRIQPSGVVRRLSRSISQGGLELPLVMSDLHWLLLQDTMAYEVGQLGIISLLELKLMVSPSCVHTAITDLLEARTHSLDHLDPLSLYTPERDARMNFIISDGSPASPPLKVLDSDDAYRQLAESESEVFTSSVVISDDESQVKLPEHLRTYLENMLEEGDDLVLLLASYLRGTLQAQVEALHQPIQTENEYPLKTYSMPHLPSFNYKFSTKQYKQTCDSVLHPTSAKPRMPSSASESSAIFRLTPVTLNYLKDSNVLVALMSSLLCVEGEKRLQDEANTEGSEITDDDHLKYMENFKSNYLESSFMHLRHHLENHQGPLNIANEVLGRLLSSVKEEDTDLLASGDCRMSIMASSGSHVYYTCIMQLLSVLTVNKEWRIALQLVNNVPSLTLADYLPLRVCRDLILCCASHALDGSIDPELIEISADFVRQINDPFLRVRTVLSSLIYWDAETCLEMLNCCLVPPVIDSPLSESVRTNIKQMKLYQRVTECAHTLRIKRSVQGDETETSIDEVGVENGLTMDKLDELQSWQNVQSHKTSTDLVLDLLLESQDYVTARQWVKLRSARPELHHLVEEQHLVSLLEQDQPNYLHIFQELERLTKEDREATYAICSQLIESVRTKQKSAFIVQYMLQMLSDQLTPTRKRQLMQISLGCKALLYLPESVRPAYDHLVSQPELLIEQLLMNMKVEWAGQILEHVKQACKEDSTFVYTDSSWDSLLIKFAKKAVEFSVIKNPISSGNSSLESSRSPSRSSLMSSNSALATLPSPTYTPSPSSSARKSKRGSTPIVAPLAQTNPAMSHSESMSQLPTDGGQSNTSLRKAASSPRSAMSSLQSAGPLLQGVAEEHFVMPAEPPSKDKWVPDASVSKCMVCKTERFSMFNRRHHCRRCGRVVCATCSARTTVIRGTSMRTCDDCYAQTFKPKAAEEDSHFRAQHSTGFISNVSGAMIASPSFQIGTPNTSSDATSDTRQLQDELVPVDEKYVLQLDEDANEQTREEFYYIQAPSPSICLSILELHSDVARCGRVILDICDEISQLLQSASPGVRNPELDYGLVISILKQLLFAAKVKLLTGSDNEGVEECEVYLDRISLLQLLISANYSIIPSMQQLTKMDSLRRLRDTLIANECLGLAMEVSTKCGIDVSGVWAVWGMTCLRRGDFLTAREKFSHCLKAPMDRNQCGWSSPLLKDIIDFLEKHTTHSVSKSEAAASRSNQCSWKDLIQEPTQNPIDASSIYALHEEECLYYIRTYGNHLMLINFYCKHDMISKALHFVLEKRCSSDVFIGGILKSCMRRDKLMELEQHMSAHDQTLEKWAHYLHDTCREYNKKRQMHSLYHTQVFMKDYIRAAMTCIRYFYLHGALNYSDLFQRIQHLMSGKQHLESYLADHQWGHPLRSGAGRGGNPQTQSTVRMIMTPAEVNKYINTVERQIDVSKFLHRYIDNLETVMAKTAPLPEALTGPQQTGGMQQQESSLPTLFGSTRMRVHLLNLILLSGNSVHDGFGLAFRIIQDFKMDYSYIYKQAAKYLALQKLYPNIRQLLSCIKDSGLCTDQAYDDVILTSVRVIADAPSEAKDVESLIKLIHLVPNKVSAYITCGKLKSAYLAAVKSQRVADVQLIRSEAIRTPGQDMVVKMCDKWLQQRGTSS